MREYGFSLTHILPYKKSTYDSALTPENTGQWKPVVLHILCSKKEKKTICNKLKDLNSVWFLSITH